MPRTARHVVPEIPHHVIQRGNRRQDVFFGEEDFRTYLALLGDQLDKTSMRLHAYCLMSNHLHLIISPQTSSDLRSIGEVHRQYTRYLNKKMGWKGYLWQGRFCSYPMDERYAYEAVRYVELNPVRAGICTHPAQYRWSSARQRIGKGGGKDMKVSPAAFLAVEDWESYWQEALSNSDAQQVFDENELIQKPLGFIKHAA